MKTKALTAAQIDTLAQRLSEAPIEPATSAKKAGDNFALFLAVLRHETQTQPRHRADASFRRGKLQRLPT